MIENRSGFSLRFSNVLLKNRMESKIRLQKESVKLSETPFLFGKISSKMINNYNGL